MFNFGVMEMMVIAVVGLVVIGPERLPKVARTLGHIFGRMQRYVSDVKSDISKEMQLEELKALQKSMKETAEEIQDSVSQQVNFIESEVQDVDKSVQKTVKEGLKDLKPKADPSVALESTSSEVDEVASSEGRRPDVSEQEEGGVDAPESLEVAGKLPKGIDLMAGLGFGSKISETVQGDSESSEEDQSVEVKKNSELG
jgi:sec-independent protein translocase protein TatB